MITTSSSIVEARQTTDYLIVANDLYVHQLSFDGTRVKTLVSGLRSARAVDFDIRYIHSTVRYCINLNYACILCVYYHIKTMKGILTSPHNRFIMHSL